MFRRSSKLTAMLVAAAAVVSIVPATAAERLGTKDGNITNAVAFNGGYIYDGYRTDDDDAAIYFNDGNKDKQIDDYDDYDMNEDDKICYGTKYVTVEDGGDEYLLDLSTGKIDDDESVQDKFDNAKSKLYTNLKKADRYSEAKAEGNKENGIIYFDRILQGQRGDVWYQYTALGDSTTDAAVTPVPGKDGKVPVTTEAAAKLDGVIYSGFANENGSKYIDITHEANIYALVKKSADANADLKTVKLSEYEKENDNVTARFLGTEALTQDNDYIYAVTTVQLIYRDGYAPEGVKNVSEQKFLQKISKAQGDKEDGAYIPKSINSYQLDVAKDLYTDDDVQEASQALGGLGTEIDGHTIVSYQVKNSTIYAVGTSKDNVKVWA